MKFRKSSQSASNVKKIVRSLVEELKKDNSIDIYEDSRIFSNLLEDRLYNNTLELNMLKIAIEANIHKNICYEITEKKTSRIKVFLSILTSQYGMTEESAICVIDMLCYAIHGFSIETNKDENEDGTISTRQRGQAVYSIVYSLSALLIFGILYALLPFEGTLYSLSFVAALAYFIVTDIRFFTKHKGSVAFKSELLGTKSNWYVGLCRHIMRILVWCVIILYCVIFGGNL